MADYLGSSLVDWARSLATTTGDYMKEVEQAMLRSYAFPALLESKGRIKYNCSGRGFTWPVQYRLHPVEGNTGETVRNFARTNLFVTAMLDYRGYQATDAISTREMLENRDKNAIVPLIDNFTERLRKSMQQALGRQWLVDGNATGNDKYWHGIESFTGYSGTVDTSLSSGYASRTANAGDLVANPSDTYAGLSTALGNKGGDQDTTSIWPAGTADTNLDYWSPLIVNTTSTNSVLNGSTHTFAAQGDQLLRYGIINSQRNEMNGKQVDTILLDRNYYFQFLNIYNTSQRIVVTSDTPLRALGFKNVVLLDGVEISWDTSVPSNTGYGFNIDNVELRCMEDSLITAKDDDFFYDPNTQTIKAAVSHLGNLKFASPRNFVKWLAVA